MSTRPDSIAIHFTGDTAIECSLPGEQRKGLPERLRMLSAMADTIRTSSISGILDVVVSPNRVTVVYDPLLIDCLATLEASIYAAASQPNAPLSEASRLHTVPVQYGKDAGPDFDAVCRSHAIDTKTLIQLHTEPEYLVTAIGFVPGFPYLEGLPETLQTPRLSTPRRQVPSGSVGIGGSQTGVYPCETPGGWHLIGRTDTNFFNPMSAPPALMQPGDRVRFHETDSVSRPDYSATFVPSCVTPQHITILEPGLMTTVQDLGRSGFRSSGVPYSGAADRVSAILANSILGNSDTAAVLEYTLFGPTVQFEADTFIALTGATNESVAPLRPLRVQRGDTLQLGHAAKGCRGYMAVAGGFCVPSVLNSCSTYVPAKLGGYHGRPLESGDRLSIGAKRIQSFSPNWSLNHELVPLPTSPCTLRILLEAPQGTAHRALTNTPMHVSAQSDRMGIRFNEPLPSLPATPLSRAVLPGTVQLPPDGKPILLLCDAQTIGGYPVLGHIIAADLPRAAQLRPGDTVCFSETTLAEAHRLLRQQHNVLATVQQGIAHTHSLTEKAV
ncbi:MAG: 5-oxoprolinase subunit PxpB [Planctomycetota bacterium]|nr:5-oxoprolinase subunit PxpB [Planctomycetota bacterium]